MICECVSNVNQNLKYLSPPTWILLAVARIRIDPDVGMLGEHGSTCIVLGESRPMQPFKNIRIDHKNIKKRLTFYLWVVCIDQLDVTSTTN